MSEVVDKEVEQESIFTYPEFRRNEQKWEILEMANNSVVERYYTLTEKGAKNLHILLNRGKLLQTDNNPCSPYDIESRIDYCYGLHLFGYSYSEIHKYVTSGGDNGADPDFFWNVKIRTIKKYIDRGKKKLFNKPQKEKLELIREAKNRWSNLSKLALNYKDLANAKGALKELDKLDGLGEEVIHVRIDDITKLSDKELLSELKGEDKSD